MYVMQKILKAAHGHPDGMLTRVVRCISRPIFWPSFFLTLNRVRTGSLFQPAGGLGDPRCGVSWSIVYYSKRSRLKRFHNYSITLSPISVASLGLVSDDRGLSLRFPRFIRLREDKSVSDASTPAFLAEMWKRQENRGKVTKGIDDGELVDVSPEASEVEEDGYDE